MIAHVLLGTLAAGGLLLIATWTRAMLSRRDDGLGVGGGWPSPLRITIGLVTNFFDTLGIGSFAPTTAFYRLFRVTPDELIPGTLIVGHALPVVAQALIFIGVVKVDPTQTALLIAACIAGGWVGASVVASLSTSAVQIGMGCALLIAAVFTVLSIYGLIPTGGTATVFSASALVGALALNFILGALLTLGIGNYAPSLVGFSLLGLDPRAAFPIMMGSGAFVTVVAGIKFLRAGRLHVSSALGLAIGGIPGVILAAWFVTSLPLVALRWLVLLVVFYTAISLLRAGLASHFSPGHISSHPGATS